MRLDQHKSLKIEHKIPVEKQQEFKFIGTGKKRSGQYLFAMNNETFEVYKVKLEKRKEFNVVSKTEIAINKAVVNPNHHFLYAINLKNAVRKFGKIISN